MNLRFREIWIKNFQSYDGDHHVSLEVPGLIYVMGENRVAPELTTNNTGKSTLFNALTWCLYGRTLDVARPGDSVEPWYGEHYTNVQVVFVRGGVEYVLDRGRNPNTLILNDESVEQDAVVRAVGLSFDAWCYCVVLGQFNELFLTSDSATQTALFTELLDLGSWVKSIDKATKNLRECEKSQDQATKTLARHEGSLAEVIDNLKDFAKGEIEWEAAHKEELAGLQNAVVLTQGEYQRAKGARPEAADVAEDEAAIAEGTTELARLTALLRDQRPKGADVQSKIDRLESAMNITYKKLKQYEDISKAEAPVCPECGQSVEVDHVDQHISKYKEDYANYEGLLKSYQDNKAKFDDMYGAAEQEAEELRGLILEMQGKVANAKNAELVWEHNVNATKLKRDGAIQDFNRSNAKINPYLASHQKAKARKQELKESIEAAKAEAKKVESYIGGVKYWVESFKQIRLSIIDEALAELTFTVNAKAEALGLSGWRLAFETERETKSGEIRSKFTSLVFPPEHTEGVPLKSLGGGVLQRCQLACALGLADVLLARAGIDCNLLVADEPTKHMSERGVENLIECLHEMVCNSNKTLFFIDHHHIDNGSFDHVLKVIKDEAGSRIEFD